MYTAYACLLWCVFWPRRAVKNVNIVYARYGKAMRTCCDKKYSTQ